MNWSEIIIDIKSFGLSQGEIAAECGISDGHVSDILHGRRGKRLGYSVGEKLIAMHKRVSRRKKKVAS